MRARHAAAASLLAMAGLMGCSDREDDPGEDFLQLGEPISESRFDQVGGDVQQSTSSATGDTLCATCATNAACGAGNYCLRRSDGVRFCGRDCRASPCPGGYRCVALSTTVSQCVPEQASCQTSPTADAGAPRDAGTTTTTGDVPSSTQCAPAATWDATASTAEAEVLRLANLRRTAGASCGGVAFAASAALTMAPALRCAARLHSKDMSVRAYFSHTTPEGVTFSQRIDRAGYVWSTVGENIASGYATPAAVVDAWMKSTGHCRNIMNPSFRELGVGLYGNGLWTQNFGTPL